MKNNLNFIPNAAVDRWNNIEIEGIKCDGQGNCEPVYNEPPDFYSVYLHQVEGGVQCIADVPTEQQAYDLANLIQNAVKSYKDNGYLTKPFGIESDKRGQGFDGLTDDTE